MEPNTKVKNLGAQLLHFLGEWLQVVFKAKFGEKGKLVIQITAIKSGTQLFHYENESMKMWENNTNYLRPKRGIYRSLKNKDALRDEVVEFPDIEIQAN